MKTKKPVQVSVLHAVARRTVLGAAIAAAGLTAATGAWAQAAWTPTKPITLVVPFAAGGATDIVGRTIAEKLGHALGQQVIVDNRAGGGTAIASNIVRAAAPDGYTLYVYPPGSMTLNILNPKVFNFDPVSAFTPITNLTRIAMVMVVNPSVPVKNIKEFVEYARSKPGQVTWGHTGVGSADHLAGLELAQRTGVKFNFVPYKGASLANQDLLAGQLDSRIDGLATAKPLADGGKMRIIATWEPNSRPGMPAVAETYPGLKFVADFSLVGPKGLPQNVVDRLNKEVVAILKMPDVAAKFAGLGLDPVPTTPQGLTQTLQSDYASYVKVIKDNNVTMPE